MPAIASITPNAAYPDANSTISLTVNGSNFISGNSAVYLNGFTEGWYKLATTFVSANQLSASFSGSYLVHAVNDEQTWMLDILVITSQNGSNCGESNQLKFSIYDFMLPPPSGPFPATVAAGNPVSYAFQLPSMSGTAFPVTMSCGGLPAGASCNFPQNPVNACGGGCSPLNFTVTTGSNTPPGTYSFTLTGTSGPVTHSVTTTNLKVTGASAPSISLNGPLPNGPNGSLIFAGSPGSTSPITFPVGVSNTGAAGSTLNWSVATTVSAPPAGNWLSASPTSGTNSGTFTVTMNASALAAGNYNGTITVSAPGAANSPQMISLTLIVGGTPTITEVDNAFSNIPNSPIQSGTWVAIKGTNLSNTSPGRGWNANENFPTSMDGTSVTINGKTAFMYYVSPGQVNVQAPTDTSLGPVSVVVMNNGVSSAPFTATYQSNSPALLQWGGGQWAYALITNGNAFVGNPAVIPNTVSAHSGDSLTLWVTGLGTTNPPLPAGQQPTTFPAIATMPTVTAGGQSVTVLGGVLRYAGLYQVNIQLPASLPTGDLPLKIVQGSFQSPDGVLINIQ